VTDYNDAPPVDRALLDFAVGLAPRVTDLAGAPLLTGNGTVLTTNGLLHTQFLELVAALPQVRDWQALSAV
jgi:histidinol-phosphatase